EIHREFGAIEFRILKTLERSQGSECGAKQSGGKRPGAPLAAVFCTQNKISARISWRRFC
ncbi:MAG TPA: hypothetical protein VNA16_10515, partial [Abditibacteriaceae bacterium]|nr:hypothetical protein [Abditibacteriaceae bacterium]